jgi:phosphohistidine phosphatase
VKLYLMRHGQAENVAETDAARPLTDKGVAQSRSQGAHLKQHLPRVAYSSPYLRAVQTTRAVMEALGRDIPHETVEGITPDDDPVEALRWLQQVNQPGPVLVVSHNPLVSSLVSLLLSGHLQGSLVMGTADIVCMDLGEVPGPGTAQLLWVERPG